MDRSHALGMVPRFSAERLLISFEGQGVQWYRPIFLFTLCLLCGLGSALAGGLIAVSQPSCLAKLKRDELLSQVSHGAIQFMVYEELRKALVGRSAQKSGAGPAAVSLSSAQITFIGALSKLTASVATYPSSVSMILSNLY